MDINAQVAKITRETIVPNLFDQVSIASPFAMATLREAEEWRSGKHDELIIKTAKSNQGGLFGIGEKLPSTRDTNRARMQFSIKGLEKPIVVDDIEVLLNKGKEQVLDAVVTEVDSMGRDLMEDFAEQLYTGTGAGDEWTGISVVADDGTNYGTYGNLSRTTYSSLNGYYAAAIGTLALSDLATGFDSVEKGNSGPTAVYTTKSIWSDYEALLTPTVAANYSAKGAPMMSADGAIGDSLSLRGTQGFQYLTYRGVPLMKDEAATSGKMFLVNTRKEGKRRNFGAIMADLKRTGNKKYSTTNFKMKDGMPKGTFGSRTAPRGFNFRDMMSPVDQLAEVGYLMFVGEFESAQPRTQGQLLGIS